MKLICPTCGGLKKDHPPHSWRVHKEMYENYVRNQREFMRYARRAQKRVRTNEENNS